MRKPLTKCAQRFEITASEIKELRSRRGWSQEQLAVVLGTQPTTISQWEHGKRRPNGTFCRRMAVLALSGERGPGRFVVARHSRVRGAVPTARHVERQELIARLNGRRIVASVSGGKDSASMSLYLHELGIDHDRVFLDTGWESTVTYEYLRGELQRVLGPITWIGGPRQMEDLIRHKGMFPGRRVRFCTQELKVFPIARHLRALMDAGNDVVNAVGIRAAESAARAHMAEWEWQEGFDCEVWRPIIRWSEEEVIAIHRRHGLRPNPLYLLGAARVGCWPCIYARKSEVRLVAETDPARIVRLRVLENDVAVAARRRAARRDTMYGSRGPTPC